MYFYEIFIYVEGCRVHDGGYEPVGADDVSDASHKGPGHTRVQPLVKICIGL